VDIDSPTRIDLPQGSAGALRHSEAYVERSVIQQNIEHYREMIKISTDLERRGVFEKLLLDEEAKLKQYDKDHKAK
jgi:hypothetical protein